MIRDGRRREEAGELEPAVAVRRAHHGNLDALIAQSSDTSGPFSFDRGPPFELEAELAKEINRPSEVIDDDSYVVHCLSAMCPIYKVPSKSDNGPFCNAEARAAWTLRDVPNSAYSGRMMGNPETDYKGTYHSVSGLQAPVPKVDCYRALC